jgi:hypothetical protein
MGTFAIIKPFCFLTRILPQFSARLGLSMTIAGSLAICVTDSTWAMTQADDIDTNRPSFMDSPLVVPKGSLQVENGTLFQHYQHGVNYYDIAETELRLGVTKTTELQMFTPNWVRLSSSATNANFAAVSGSSPGIAQSGVSDLGEAGIKHQFKPRFKDLNYAFIGGVNIPTGRRLISGDGVQPVMRVPWTKGLSKNWSVGGMQSILVVNGGRDAQWQNFFLISRAFGARTSVFTEYGGFYTHHQRSLDIAHFGAVRKLNKNNQIDLQFGFALDRTAPAAFVGVGYSFRFDRLPIIEKL